MIVVQLVGNREQVVPLLFREHALHDLDIGLVQVDLREITALVRIHRSELLRHETVKCREVPIAVLDPIDAIRPVMTGPNSILILCTDACNGHCSK